MRSNLVPVPPLDAGAASCVLIFWRNSFLSSSLIMSRIENDFAGTALQACQLEPCDCHR